MVIKNIHKGQSRLNYVQHDYVARQALSMPRGISTTWPQTACSCRAQLNSQLTASAAAAFYHFKWPSAKQTSSDLPRLDEIRRLKPLPLFCHVTAGPNSFEFGTALARRLALQPSIYTYPIIPDCLYNEFNWQAKKKGRG